MDINNLKEVDNLQQEELKLLCQFKAYCNRFNLRYFLEGGTLLGAVRHKGFIPWDDDIDTIMPRMDYDRFLELTTSIPMGENIKIVTDKSGDGFDFPFIKICNSDTILCEGGRVETTGLFIDVFPMDGAPNSELWLKIRYRYMDFIKSLERYSKMPENAVADLSFLRRIKAWVSQKIGREYWKRYLDRFFRKYKCGETKFVSQIAWSDRMVYNLSSEYLQPVELIFEGESFTVPSCYHKRLQFMYDDYMQLPPEDKRNSKHAIKAYWKNH